MTSRRAHLSLCPDPEPLGEVRSLDAAYRRFAPYVAKLGTRLLGHQDDVDDLIQEVFLRATEKIDQLRDPEAMKAWLRAIAVRRARAKLEHRRRRAFFGLGSAADYDSLASPSAAPEVGITLRRLFLALDELPASVRVAWSLRYLEEEPLDVVAELCHCSLATAKRRITQAQDALQKELSDG